ncbi:transketolase [Candidatus Dependentiae bacterium]|nr:transketolase [Candidatus Dependentiae bacterium]
MRKEFSSAIEKYSLSNEKIIFLTGDLGFMALENVAASLQNRFINMGVSEQNMIAAAAGLASEGLIPVCYSIAPFAVFRPAEQIRLDVCLHNMNVKIVGNGGGYGYGIMGATHHSIEDIAVMSAFQNMKCYIPFCNEDVDNIVYNMLNSEGPAYLRLGFGNKPDSAALTEYRPVRKISEGTYATIIGVGPVLLNVFDALKLAGLKKSGADLFVISEMPVLELSEELLESIKKTKKILIIEEHVKRGGLGENLSLLLMEKNINCKFTHLFAKGYPDGLYGSQKFHQKTNGLDSSNIALRLKELANE